MPNDKVREAINTYNEVDGKNIDQGMLSSPHIHFCIKKFKIIENYDESCIKPASYDMRLGRKFLTWENGKRVEFYIGKEEDKNRNIFKSIDLKPNSLSFITTIEKFNLPKDIIARFNLKSIWVHQGLLLGTGPIVDPELQAHILIPLHNFSSENITLYYGEKIISVEFTKTLNPDDKFKNNSEIKYVKNKNAIFDFDGYRKRIERKKIESSVLSKFFEYDDKLKYYENQINRYRNLIGKFSWGTAIAFFLTLIGLSTLVITTWSFVSNAREELVKSSSIISNYNSEINKLKKKNEDMYSRINKLESIIIKIQE